MPNSKQPTKQPNNPALSSPTLSSPALSSLAPSPLSPVMPPVMPPALLSEEQQSAIDIEKNIWVSAAAGSGKTKVLIDRLLNLLLAGITPKHILVVTFTKAAAAEIRKRLDDKLIQWTGLSESDLSQDILMLNPALAKQLQQPKQQLNGQKQLKKLLGRAKNLFYQIMDERQNLNISTIHSFCGQLLSHFPIEAEIPIGFRVWDELEQQSYINLALQTIFQRTDKTLEHLLQPLSQYGLNETTIKQQILSYLTDLKTTPNQSTTNRPIKINFAELINAAHNDATPNDAANKKTESTLNTDDYPTRIAHYQQQKQKLLLSLTEFFPEPTEPEATNNTDPATSERIYTNIFTQEHKIRQTHYKKNPPWLSVAEKIATLTQQIAIESSAHQSQLIAQLALLVRDHYELLKFEMGALDYDDLIIKTAALLSDQNHAHPWVNHKLAGSIRHILLDEAQDTNPDQWRVIRCLMAPFLENNFKTSFFIVGDGKQSIYSFQKVKIDTYFQVKTDLEKTYPANFMTKDFRRSYRSGRAILNFVDKVFTHEKLALGEVLTSHAQHENQLSAVMLQPLVTFAARPPTNPDESGEPPPDRLPKILVYQQYIDNLAQTIKSHIGRTLIDDKGQQRRASANDIMVLLQKRNHFQLPLVRALKNHAVPVAGLDRLLLKDELLVQDLLNLAHWTLQPHQDFYLANLLTSPFLAMAYTELENLILNPPNAPLNLSGWRRHGSLWLKLQHAAQHDKTWQLVQQWLAQLLQLQQQHTPYEFFFHLLNRPCPLAASAFWRLAQPPLTANPIKAIEALLGRLGREEAEILHVFFDLVLAIETKSTTTSMAHTLQQLEDSQAEMKNEIMGQHSQGVRIMTCHGAKGLESPIVFLPDSLDSAKTKEQAFLETEQGFKLFLPNKDLRPERLNQPWQNRVKANQQEKIRLLYVALTRAKNLLIISGIHSKKKSGELSSGYDSSWYDLCHRAMQTLPHQTLADGCMVFGQWSDITGSELMGSELMQQEPKGQENTGQKTMGNELTAEFNWLQQPLPKHLQLNPDVNPKLAANSAITQPPTKNPITTAAQQRGIQIHLLLQTLPQLPPTATLPDHAMRILTNHFPNLTKTETHEIITEALTVLQKPEFQAIFQAPALNEIPLIQLPTRSSNGPTTEMLRPDRIITLPDRIMIIDYKTTKQTTNHAHAIEPKIIQQLQHYKKILSSIYPYKKITTAVLFTRTANLIELPDNP